MRQWIVFCTGAASAALAVSSFQYISPRLTTVSAQGPGRITPLSASYNTTVFKGNDAVPFSSETKGFAVRSDGSSVELFYRPDPEDSSKISTLRIVTDVATRKRVNLVPFAKRKTTYSLSPRDLSAAVMHPVAGCVGKPSGTLLGFPVVKSSEEIAGSNLLGPAFDKIKTDSWYAPDLNCLALRSESSYLKGVSVQQRTVVQYLEIRLGEPEKEMFQVPEEYTEGSPSEVMAATQRLYPHNKAFATAGCDNSAKDSVYHSGQK